VQLDSPFVDVLIRLEDLGHDHWEVDDDALRVVAARSGDVVALGDRVFVEIIDAAILRRTVYAKRVNEAGDGPRADRGDGPRADKGDGRQRRGPERGPANGKGKGDRDKPGDRGKPGAPARGAPPGRYGTPDRKTSAKGGKGPGAGGPSKGGKGKSKGNGGGSGRAGSGGGGGGGGRTSGGKGGKGKAGRRR
jgi:ribonuclease R